MQTVVPSSLIQPIPAVILGSKCQQSATAFIFIVQVATWLLFSHTAWLFVVEISHFLVEVVPDFHQSLETTKALTLTLIPAAFCGCVMLDKLQPANWLPDYKQYFWHSNYWKLLVV